MFLYCKYLLVAGSQSQVHFSPKATLAEMGGGDELQRLSGGENCILGMVTGVMSKCCNYPLLSWKNTVQQGQPISLNPAVVYRGLPMACMNLGGTNAVQFGTTGLFQKLLATSGAGQDAVQVGGSFLGGLVSGLPCSIWELCMIQQQRFGGTTLGTPQRIVGEHGMGALSRGVTMTMGRESLFTMSMLGLTPLIQRALVEKSGMDKNMALAGGSLIGALFAGAATHPMDTIKTCMQGDLHMEKYKGITQTGLFTVCSHCLFTACSHAIQRGAHPHTETFPTHRHCESLGFHSKRLSYSREPSFVPPPLHPLNPPSNPIATSKTHFLCRLLFSSLNPFPFFQESLLWSFNPSPVFEESLLWSFNPFLSAALSLSFPVGRVLAEEYGVVQGLFKGFSYRTGLIATTFFLINTLKSKMVPIIFPHTIED